MERSLADPLDQVRIRDAIAVLAEYVGEAQIASVVLTSLQNKDVVVSVMQRPGDKVEPYVRFEHKAGALRSCR